MSRTKYTTAAKMLADLTGNPALESEVEAELARRRELDALVAERAKANLTVGEVAKRMNVTEDFVRRFEETGADPEAEPLVMALYADAVRRGSVNNAKGTTRDETEKRKMAL